MHRKGGKVKKLNNIAAERKSLLPNKLDSRIIFTSFFCLCSPVVASRVVMNWVGTYTKKVDLASTTFVLGIIR